MNLWRPLRKLMLSYTPSVTQSRPFFRMLNEINNKPDIERIKEVGPDRTCAEWLLRCSAHFRWKNSDYFFTDYNSLPTTISHELKIEEIDANGAPLMMIGFRHFVGCEHIKKIRFFNCDYLDDSAIIQLRFLKDSLEELEITNNGNVSDEGVLSLTTLCNLKELLLQDLPEVKDKQNVYKALTQALPDCEVTYVDYNISKKGGG